ncbi:methyl-accepting chemotaxis protein [Edwardsiella tarda]|uniref:methyl-accepting chemotaxis protein n=1 Tax=Edwardsiella tarda TaxID=636 RepID=UPI00351C5059
MTWKNTQGRIVLLFISFFIVLIVVSNIIIKLFISPQLVETEVRNIKVTAEAQSDIIKEQMNRVKAQQRAITELVSNLPSEQLDHLLPPLINQYGDSNIFGGGIWPLPGKRDPAKERFSTFYARDAGGVLQLNSVWNQPSSQKYWQQSWYLAGLNAPAGECAWANAYQDAASSQPRTNCAMAISKNGQPWGVSTIDVTLGFFNQLAQQMSKTIDGTVLIVEADGKIIGDGTPNAEHATLANLRDISLPLAAPLLTLLKQEDKGERQSEYQGEDGRHSLFLLPIAGTPWYLAVDVTNRLLEHHSFEVLSQLAIIQGVMGVIIVLILMAIIRNVFANVTLLNNNIKALSSGGADLTRRLAASRSPEFNQVVDNFNAFISFLHQLMRQVEQSALAISSASRQIAGGNIDLSSRTEEQSAAIVETAASMEEVTGSVRLNANNAQQAHQLASQAANAAKAGTEVVNEVVTTMGHISHSSAEIVEIIAVIDGIAFQTNILALNAAVEAARAGEHGRGFAVVASEVRALAQRSAQSAQEIKKLIETSVSNIGQGSELVRQAGDSMHALAQKVEDVNLLISEISHASDEQSRGIEQITVAITQLDSTTQQNAVLVEEVATAAQSMEEQTVQLAQVVRSFKL